MLTQIASAIGVSGRGGGAWVVRPICIAMIASLGEVGDRSRFCVIGTDRTAVVFPTAHFTRYNSTVAL